MKNAIIPIFLFLCCTAVAQPRIRTDAAVGARGTTFYLEGKDRPGTLTVYLTFTELHNCTTSPGTTKYEVEHNSFRLTNLRPSDESYGVGYRYSYRYFYGPIDHTPDTAFVYRLPYSTQKSVRVIQTVSVLDKYSKEAEDHQQLGFHFALERGDTIYAMRRGIVTRIEREKKPEYEVSFTTESTNITVEQPDGSFAWYICLDDANLLVSSGDEVLPGTPLGLAGTYDGQHYKVSVQTCWYITNPDETAREKQMSVSKRFFPRFATTEGVKSLEHGGFYTPVMTDQMITQEMTKRELRQLHGNK